MAENKIKLSSEAYPMNGGDGQYSYIKNSSSQRGVIDAAKELMSEAIAEKLDIKSFSSSNAFRIADLGCSVGPNTFFAVQNILESVAKKYQCLGLSSTSELPEFQAFFNDQTLNDFNTLFTSLPSNRQYYAAGVPGSFYGRLFPNASLHIVHSSYSIQWLSKVPEEVVDKSSPAWNKGRIHYSKAGDEVVEAYAAQHAKDMECFLHARAQEIVCGGLMVLILPGCPNEIPHSEVIINITFELLGSCFTDLVNEGIISEEKVDSFNIPFYVMSPQELEAAIELNGCFSIEKMESLPQVTPHLSLPKVQFYSLHMRSGIEGLIKEHFGYKILDQLFDLYTKKLQESSIYELGRQFSYFVLLKRKSTD